MNFLHNIVADLREKRLLPVVALLVLAAIAIPVFARNRGPSEPRGDGGSLAIPETKAPLGAGQSIVTLEEQPNSKHKKLDAFKRKNPFVQQARSNSKSESGSVTPIGSGDSSGTTTSTGTGSVTAGSGSSGSSTSTTGSTSETSGSSKTTGTSNETDRSRGSTGDGTSSDAGSDSTGSSRVTKLYRWTVTVRFGPLGEEKIHDDLTLLSPLPSSEDPVVTFLGISQNSRAAVFLLDRGVLQEGEGTCRPSQAICAYVYLHEDEKRDEHTFYRESDPDRKYRVKLKSVDLVESKSPVKLKTSQDAQSLGSSLRLSVHHDVRDSG